MTNFTDADLKRWKGQESGMLIPFNALLQIKALIRRLEAAEIAVMAAVTLLEDSKCDAGCWSGMDPCTHRVLHHEVEEWRKSKGEME